MWNTLLRCGQLGYWPENVVSFELLVMNRVLTRVEKLLWNLFRHHSIGRKYLQQTLNRHDPRAVIHVKSSFERISLCLHLQESTICDGAIEAQAYVYNAFYKIRVWKQWPSSCYTVHPVMRPWLRIIHCINCCNACRSCCSDDQF